MKPYVANLINAIVLILMGAWGVFAATGTVDSSNTKFIPIVFGALFLFATPMFKQGNKIVVHIVVLLTALAIVGFGVPLFRKIGDPEATMSIVRVSIEILSCLFALVIFIKSFIDARKARV